MLPRLTLTLLIAWTATSAAEEPEHAGEPRRAAFRLLVRADREGRALPDGRSTSRVSRDDLMRRLPRSAPDALRYEAGVFVQQSAHGQGSAYIRGLTGQQTLLMFDGIRLNNSTYRQGPNQYFFTLDARTIDSIEVLRGGGSTRYGSDALGGVIMAHPIEASAPGQGFTFRPSIEGRLTSADREKGGRAQLTLGVGRPGWALAFVGGVGGRDVGLLESAGSVTNPNPGTPFGRYPQVPRFESDGRTQRGTGFRELSADGRLSLHLGRARRHTLVAAAYLYRQHDTPRTDHCPPPSARFDTCLTYEEQFRHLMYLAWDGGFGPLLRRLRVSLSYQQQHEVRRLDQPALFARLRGSDDVHTLGLVASGQSALYRPHPRVALGLRYGLDAYLDLVRSTEILAYTDVNIISRNSRGQYLDGSTYLYTGAYADGEAWLGERLVLRGGARLSFVRARAPADEGSGSSAVDKSWLPIVGHGGVEWRILPALHVLLHIDHSFRAPNLDDLTSRQQTGPGFQFENAGLRPERATAFEAGLRLRTRFLIADLWAYEMLISSAVVKVSRTAQECPASTPQCRGSWSRYQLVNAPALSEVRGVEGTLRMDLPLGIFLRGTLAYAWGEGPRIGGLSEEVSGISLGERVPLSRVPPLSGTLEAHLRHPIGLTVGAALRWAAAQERLAIADYSDGRIPKYGTPGFAVVDLRISFRVDERLYFAAVMENLLDAPHRYHGSSINGPGRGVILTVQVN